jgi:hypothetical protein
MLSGFSCQPDRVCSVTDDKSVVSKTMYLRNIHSTISSRGKIDEIMLNITLIGKYFSPIIIRFGQGYKYSILMLIRID